MAFWSKLGKGLLKVGKVAAPIALGMTGVGIPAAMAVSGGLNALDKKVSGGSWKGALGAGLMGAGTGALGAGAGQAIRGIGPSASGFSKMFGPGGMGAKGIKAGMSGMKAASKFMNRPRRPVPFTPGFNPNAPSPYGMMGGGGGQQQMGPMMQNFRNRQTMMAPRANQFQNLGY